MRMPLGTPLRNPALIRPLFGKRITSMRRLIYCPDEPSIWPAGSKDSVDHLEVEVAGAGVFIHASRFHVFKPQLKPRPGLGLD